MADRTFLGFGFGAIQTGLMLYEAQASGNFRRFIVSEVDQTLVEAVRRNGNSVSVNIARRGGIEGARLPGIEIHNPLDADGRERISQGIREADEMATAIPSVSLYSAGGDDSIAALLAENVDTQRDRILYAAENNNYAAEILREEIAGRAELRKLDRKRIERLHIVNTVIGKMSGVIQGCETMEGMGLEPMTPDSGRAILVEEFNRILISRLPRGVARGITVFQEKDDLLPFEEAKLYGHNAIHSLLGYLAAMKGYRVMSQIGRDAALMELGRRAFLEESGAALIKKHRGTGDELFTPEGFRDYALDLIERMVNPYLHDLVARICRDPIRKLGYSDRLFGAMREALRQDIRPAVLAMGAFAGLVYLVEREGADAVSAPADREGLDDPAIARILEALWRREQELDRYADECIRLVQEARIACNPS